MSILSFTPLNKGEIRLLSFAGHVLPTSDALMSLSLTVFKLHEAPPYTALSYEWGPASDSKSILLNETRIPIRDNLFAFLQRYRDSGQGGYLWIDALCINQSDLIERGHQVRYMGDIYKKGFRVIAWLGAGPPKLVQAFSRLAELVGRSHNLNHVALSKLRSDELKDLDDDHPAFLMVLSKLVAQDLLEVACSTYWTRMWIIQEFLLAQDVEIWCGESRSHYRTLDILIRRLCDHISLQLTNEVDEGTMGSEVQARLPEFQLGQVSKIMVLRKYGVGRQEKTINITIDWLLDVSGYARCADIRDHVYGLLGLMDKEDLKSYPISPNYNKSASELFLDLCLRKMKQLEAREWRERGPQAIDGLASILRYALKLRNDDGMVLLVSALANMEASRHNAKAF